MSGEVSSDVTLLINQLDEVSKNTSELKIVYNDQIINGENRLTKEETENEPMIETKNESIFKTLVCFFFFFSSNISSFAKQKGDDRSRCSII